VAMLTVGDTVKTPDGGHRRCMVVFLNARDPNASSKLRFFCKKNNIGKQHLENNAFAVTGLYDDILRLTDQSYVRDWHWDGGGEVLKAQGQSKKFGSHGQGKHR
jgi:hypothetical protein